MENGYGDLLLFDFMVLPPNEFLEKELKFWLDSNQSTVEGGFTSPYSINRVTDDLIFFSYDLKIDIVCDYGLFEHLGGGELSAL